MTTPVVTLTFDNGPTPGITEPVLELLAEHRVPATFFAIGRNLASPDGQALGRRIVADGHRLGGHTWSHAMQFGGADDRAVVQELSNTRAVVEEVGGDGLLFRPYGAGGVIDDRLMSSFGAASLSSSGYTCVLWNVVPGDWKDQDGWVELALSEIDRLPWSVVVLHDVADAALDSARRVPDGGREPQPHLVAGVPRRLHADPQWCGNVVVRHALHRQLITRTVHLRSGHGDALRHHLGIDRGHDPGCDRCRARRHGPDVGGVRRTCRAARRRVHRGRARSRLQDRAVHVQRQRVPRGPVRGVQDPRRADQRQLPLPRRRAVVPARQLPTPKRWCSIRRSATGSPRSSTACPSSSC